MQNYSGVKKGHEIIAFVSNRHYFDVENMNMPIRSLACLHLPTILGRYLLEAAGYNWHMFGLEKELKSIDIAHTVETIWAFSYQCIKSKKKYGTKVVVSQWENIPFSHETPPMRRIIKTLIKKHSDMFIAVTHKAKKALMLEGVPENKIKVIFMGLDLKIFKPTPKDPALLEKFKLNFEDEVILFVGRLTYEKGIYPLIYAFKNLLRTRKMKAPKLLFVGYGPEKAQMIKLCSRLGILESIRFVGSVPHQFIHKVHNLADIFVLPSIPTKSWQEQFGMALVEAMACGKPVVSTLSGSMPEVVGNAGVLVQPNDFKSLSNAISDLLADETERTRLGKLARERTQREFDCEKIAFRLSEVYESLA